ncbi:SDR family oxidoreductase [Aquimarina sp. D1M17]|uniref:SDR family NAD(P)-dependent oxidoreductase n=1 Tax=Aquimarina acroporae TaxID=2937283 RepID=UPI0020BF6A3B|nr:SDR family oxidoreductase [Aquimarina acroporae]MCK8521283.1 SDR family oxidoreductase [Aquimarina acroporae]
MKPEVKIALITGGSRGLGRSIALMLAKKGHDVIITYRSKKEEASEVVKAIESLGQKSVALPLDIGELSSLEDFKENFKQTLLNHFKSEHFDFLINNAGIGVSIPFEQVDMTTFDQFTNIHLKGVFFLTQHLLPLIQNGGRIINVSSATTRYYIPGYALYATIKGSIETFTKYLAQEIGARGITANVIAPGPVETDFNGGMVRDNQKINEVLSSKSALGRVGQPQDIGGIVAFLCSQESEWITGQRIEASGGMNL